MRFHIVVFLVVAIFGVLFTPACSMPVKPAMKQSTDRLLANYKPNPRTIAAAKSYQPKSWRVGQWATYRLKDSKGNVSHIKYAIVAKDSCGIWLEVDTQAYYGREIQKTCYSSMPSALAYDTKGTGQSVLDPVQIVVTKRDNSKPQVMDFRKEGSFAKTVLQAVSVNTAVKLYFGPGMPRDTLKVMAGTFQKTFRAEAKLKFGPFGYQAKIWSHPTVPITGQVYSKSKDGKYITELLAFGDQGAKSVLLAYP